MKESTVIGAATLALCLTSSGVPAQQAGDAAVPPRLTFNLGSSLTYDDNPDLSVTGSGPLTSLDTRLGLDLNTATPGQSLQFGLNGLGRVTSGDGLVFRDPSANLAYTLDGANSRLSVTALYQQSPVDLFEPVVASDGSVTPTDILATSGKITTSSAGFSFETGLQGPLGFDLSGNYSGRAYSDTSDPSVYDSTSEDLTAAVHLRMATGGDLSLTASASQTDYQNATQTLRNGSDLSLGYSQDLRPGLALQASLGESRTTTRESGSADSTSTGAIGSLGLDADLVNGQASVQLSSTRDAVGARQSLSFGRSLELPTGNLDATFGLSGRRGEGSQLIGTLSYSYTLPTDNFGVNLSRQVVLNADNLDVANTVLGVTYQHQINDVSSLGLSVNLLATGGGGSPGVDDALRQSFSTTYTRDLTADWQLATGYQFRSLDQSSVGTAQSNSVFLTISRKFTLRP
ncbi:MAG: hypothetical protein ABI832_08585 [bacterium]